MAVSSVGNGQSGQRLPADCVLVFSRQNFWVVIYFFLIFSPPTRPPPPTASSRHTGVDSIFTVATRYVYLSTLRPPQVAFTFGSSINLGDLTYQNVWYLPLVSGDVDSRLILRWLIAFNLSSWTYSGLEPEVLVLNTSPLITWVTELARSSSNIYLWNWWSTISLPAISNHLVFTVRKDVWLIDPPQCVSSHLWYFPHRPWPNCCHGCVL